MNLAHLALIIIIQVCFEKDLDNLQFCERNIGSGVICKLWSFSHGLKASLDLHICNHHQ
jgi:hypothetical protein